MSLPRYPNYKDSGVEWLGEVPEHWEVCSFRHCLSQMFNGLAATQVDEADGTVPVTRIETISYGVIDESRLGFISSDDAREDRRLLDGDILFSNINSLNMVGKCAYYGGGRLIYAGMNLLVLRPSAICYPPWLCWLVRSIGFRNVVESLAKPAINQASVSQSSVNSIVVSTPPLHEQTQIAAFLDRETAKIDELVAEQRRLMALLKEKRQAVISHAVTRGLNPHAPLKPSGIEWLGDVPEHWDMKPIKHLGKIISGFAFKSGDFTSAGVRVLKIANIQTYAIDWTDDSYVPESFYQAHSSFAVQNGDVVFALTRPIISTGLKAAIADIGEEHVLLNQRNAIFRPDSKLDKHFIYQFLFSDSFRVDFENKIDATGQQPNISPIDIGEIRIPLPPMQEQAAIGNNLKAITLEFDTLATEAQRAIDLLQERRTALISAAVTGQIDVRGAVAV